MPNIAQFNSNLFNSWGRLWGAGQITDDLIFNGLWLQNQFIITSKIDFWNMPKTNLLTYTNPKSDWWGVLDRFFKDRTITIEGVILWTDADDLETRIDAIKKVLSVKTWYLQMKIKWTYRRILATLTNQDIFDRKHSDITRAPFKLTFKAMQPFRREKDILSNSFKNISSNTTESLYNPWSVYSNPKFTITINSANNMNELSLWIGDNTILLSWMTEVEVVGATFWGEVVALTAWADNTWSGVRPSTLTAIVISLNGSIPSCLVGWTQIVELTEQSETQRFGTTQQGTIITITLQITRNDTIETWDEIIIDSEEKTVSINWVSTDFAWKFPFLDPWTNILTITWNGTFNMDISVLYPKNYL